jgi:uncharacterized protein YraI
MDRIQRQRLWSSVGVLLLLMVLISTNVFVSAQDAEVPSQTVLGVISDASPEVQYSLSGEVGQPVQVEAISVTDGLTLQFIIADSNGTLVLAVGNAEQVMTVGGSFTFADTSTYTVTVVSANDTQGDFVLRVAGKATISDPQGPIARPQDSEPVSCSVLVDRAIIEVSTNCEGTERNQACYGNMQLLAEPRENADPFVFASPGDLIGVETIGRLEVSSMDVETSVWGVALLKLQANLPDTLPGQNVTVLVLGDVKMENAGGESAAQIVPIVALSNVNIRSGPGTSFSRVGALQSGQSIQADGQLIDGSWVRVQLEDGNKGWIYATYVVAEIGFALDGLNFVSEQGGSDQYAPMQAFYFSAGIGQPQCSEAPENGIMIQTPSGVGQVSLRVNDVNISLGSTAFLRAQPGGMLTVSMLEGTGEVEAHGTTRVAVEGTQVSVPLSDDLSPTGPPGFPEPVDVGVLRPLPVHLLPEFVVIPEPVDPMDLPVLATSGACVMATISETAVNVRSGPGTDFGVTGSMNPVEIYNVIGRNSDSSWYQMAGSGWAAASVTRRGGNCDSVPVTYVEVPPSPTPVPTEEVGAPTIAGDNEYPAVYVDFNGPAVTIGGELSFPEGDRSDTVTFYFTNLPMQTYSGRVFSLTITCAGSTDNAAIVFPNGGREPCTGNGFNTVMRPYSTEGPAGSFTIVLEGEFYIVWSAVLKFMDG